MELPRVVSQSEWKSARKALLEKEKEATRARDALAAERRRLPMVRVEKDYRFSGPAGGASLVRGPGGEANRVLGPGGEASRVLGPGGEASLVDLFEGRRQLLVYRFFFDPDMDTYPEAGCSGCSMFTDQIGHLAHLHARDTTFALVSAAPVADIERFRARMGWDIPWYSTTDSFSQDFDVPTMFGLNVFLRDGADVYRTYFTTGRGVEALGSVWTFLDLTPLGRQEDWEDSPPGYPQTRRYQWWQLHDEYDSPEVAA